ncbi:ATP-grasp fold amidoligase family protein [Mesobacillus harenae]|uniref:ATP-grasp fold amidoligase family protein n=1 Tax=Mesobacillus harenae TaxID=2213203 RepID=UPI00158065FC|nr:ATP-grasp fold amidoligase family protein [Mesobacillus harenae]
MSVLEKFKRIKENDRVLLIWNEQRRIRGNLDFKKVSDEEYVQKLYQDAFKKTLDLTNPQTFNEKLQWLKLNYRDSLMTQCADKYGVRQYLEDKGYGYLLNELIAQYESVDDINLEELPDRFVLKGTHGSGWNLIVHQKDQINWPVWKKIMKSWMKQNLYFYGREWVYRDIKPRIICEKYLEDSSGELRDYKVFCFNGEPRMIQVDLGRFSNHRRNLYDPQWNLMPFRINYENSETEVEKPNSLQSMIRIAGELSKDFPHVRADFYDVNGKLYFGELTFFHESGTGKFEPEEYDRIIGDWLTLPPKITGE